MPDDSIVPVSQPPEPPEPKGEAKGLKITERGVEFYTTREALGFARACLESGLLPKQIRTPQQAFVIMARGAELGLKPFAAWSAIYLTKANRLAIMTKAALGVIRRSGLLEDYKEWTEGAGEELKAVASAKRRGQPSAIVEEFSFDDAKTAGLLDKKRNREGEEYDSTYDKYLKDMLKSRARGRCLEQGFSDVLLGIALEGIAEDADAAEAERGEPRDVTPPKPAGPDPLVQQLRAEAPTPGRFDASEPPAQTTPAPGCGRCRGALNDMGGCDVCGWPGEDIR